MPELETAKELRGLIPLYPEIAHQLNTAANQLERAKYAFEAFHILYSGSVVCQAADPNDDGDYARLCELIGD